MPILREKKDEVPDIVSFFRRCRSERLGREAKLERAFEPIEKAINGLVAANLIADGTLIRTYKSVSFVAPDDQVLVSIQSVFRSQTQDDEEVVLELDLGGGERRRDLPVYAILERFIKVIEPYV